MQYPSMTVYSASAGSGKTFTLAVRYIELLINNPYSYRETLAVTFTNKATEEMKLRIMSQLYGLAHSLKDSDGYLRRIMADMGATEKLIRERAALALRLIMHDYNHFAVETIDAFFQRVLRNLARELELSPNLRVELNDTDVEEMAVDELVTELRHGSEVLDWIMEYVSQQMEDEKDWNVITNIKAFGRKIFSEQYKQNAKALNDKLNEANFFQRFRQRMRELATGTDAEETMRQRAEEFFQMIAADGYSPNDFLGRSRSACSYFTKLESGRYLDSPTPVVTKTIRDAIDSPEGWTRANPDTPIYIYARDVLVPFIQRVEEERLDLQRTTMTAQQVLRHLNDLRLLHNIERKVRALNEEEGRFLLSDTQSFLEELMKPNDAPFVYEKIGGRLQNIMIDEFQDTSTVQWRNFKKLLLNTLSEEGSQNLIVGDVKQSIYRWRNGDWSLLQNMDADSDISSHSYKREVLRENWRSEERIINFNNSFFEQAAKVFESYLNEEQTDNAALISEIYKPSNLHQIVPEKKRNSADYSVRGLIEITLLGAESRHDAKEQLERTAQTVRRLLDAGAKESDIAILLRDNRHISQLADYLQQQIPNHRFVSNEAFRLDASVAIGIIITAMRVLMSKGDQLSKSLLAKNYQEQVLGNEVDLSIYGEKQPIDILLPQDFINRTEELKSMPLVDIAEQLARIFELDKLKNEAAYIFSFNDLLSSFTQNNAPDLACFINLWDESLHEKTVKNGDLQGISLITIHKSKGLEFKHVIMPFCNWEITHRSGVTLWCKTDEEPFAELPVVPVSSTSLRNTVYSSDYQRESLQNCIDNLNLLYVAFTRAAQNLFVIGQNMTTKNGFISSTTISGFIQLTLPLLVNSLEGAVGPSDSQNNQEEITFTYGSLTVTPSKQHRSENVFLKTGTEHFVEINHNTARIEFRQSNESRRFVGGEPAEDNSYIEIGTILHDVLSQISTHKDIDRVLANFERQGLIANRDAHKMSEFLRKRLCENKHAEIAEWFADDAQVLSECSIVFADPRSGIATQRRPDRIVISSNGITIIDFKFGNPQRQHRDQVEKYKALLRDMGHSNVNACLWYVYQNEITTI